MDRLGQAKDFLRLAVATFFRSNQAHWSSAISSVGASVLGQGYRQRGARLLRLRWRRLRCSRPRWV